MRLLRELIVVTDGESFGEGGATCDRIIRMRDGRIVADERVAQVRAVAA